MKEDDIRPSELRKKHEKLFSLDARKLIDKLSDFVEINCPACDHYNSKVEFNKNGYIFRKCQNCQTLYISPRPTSEMLKEYYTASMTAKFWQEEMYPVSRNTRIEKLYKPRIAMIDRLLADYGIGTELIVEVGAGSGDFGIELAKRNIFKKIILIEPCPIKKNNNFNNIEIINDVIENVKLEQCPDIVANFELIAQLFSPAEFVKSIYALLGNNSFFIFTMPNIEGFELLTIYDKSSNVVGPNHLNYFNPISIRILLQRIGFRHIEISTPGELDADIVKNRHIEGVIDISGQPFLHLLLIQRPELYLEPFQAFLQKNNLSSHMLVLAKK